MANLTLGTTATLNGADNQINYILLGVDLDSMLPCAGCGNLTTDGIDIYHFADDGTSVDYTNLFVCSNECAVAAVQKQEAS